MITTTYCKNYFKLGQIGIKLIEVLFRNDQCVVSIIKVNILIYWTAECVLYHCKLVLSFQVSVYLSSAFI